MNLTGTIDNNHRGETTNGDAMEAGCLVVITFSSFDDPLAVTYRAPSSRRTEL
jgi:hypothetical protein